MSEPETTAKPLLSWRTFGLLIVLALAVRLWLVATTIGTNDVIFKMLWASLIERFGVAGAYAQHDLLNNAGIKVALFPPLILLNFKAMLVISEWTGIEFTDVLRLFQVAADFLAAGMLWIIGRRLTPTVDPRTYALFYLFSPVVIFVSAFHCNTDSTMVALLAVSIALMPWGRKGAAGAAIALAAATGVKILPLFLLPFFAFAAYRAGRAISFSVAYVVSMMAIFVPAAVLGGNDVVHRILAYASYPGYWGFAGALGQAGETTGSERLMEAARLYYENGKYLVMLSIGLLWLWLVRGVMSDKGERNRDPQYLVAMTFPLVFLLALLFAPGFGVQYLLWPVAFLPFLFGWRWSVALVTVFSIHLFATYTVWSEGFPWWYADSMNRTVVPLLKATGFVAWLAILVVVPRGLRQLKAQFMTEGSRPGAGAA